MIDGFSSSLDCTPEQWEWLNSADSLTARLRHFTDHQTSMELLYAGWGEALPEEKAAFSETLSAVWIRQIIHQYRQIPWIWARVIIPEHTLQTTGLDGGTPHPIGDILFQDPNLTRTDLMFARLTIRHPYYQQIRQYLSPKTTQVCARRSMLWFHQQPLLINEVFLPAFFDENNL